MKKFLLAFAIVIVGGILSLFVFTKFLGPKIIHVAAPTGEPVGKFDVPRPESSLLTVKIAVPIQMMNDLASKEIPAQFEGREKKSIHKRIKNGSYAWKAVRGDFVFENSGDRLAFATPFQGAAKVKGNLDAKILTIPIDSDVQIEGAIGGTVTPKILPDWQVDPQLVPQIQLSKASLNIGQLGRLDVSDLVGGSLGQYIQKEARKLTPAIRKKLNVRKSVSKLWHQAYLTRLISDDPKVWIRIDPQEVVLAPIDYSVPDRISFTLGIRSETIVTNREPGAPEKQPLPDLVPLDGPVPTELRLPLIVGMKELNEVLAAENIDIDTGIGTKIEISGMEAQIAQNGLLNLKLNIEADKSRLGRGVVGEIWVKARPVIDYEEQSLGFTDVELTVETKDKLTTAAAWLLEGLLTKGLESQLRVDLDDYQAEINEEVQKGLASADLPEGINVSVENLNITLQDIYTITRHSPEAAPDPGVVIVIRATGDLATEVNELLLKPDEEE
ncbi:MAG: DUF4403 family protein [Verrucomicrobiales bacterium]|nr:DUF4403 family protein [Verrucomicrobiales bacterium]